MVSALAWGTRRCRMTKARAQPMRSPCACQSGLNQRCDECGTFMRRLGPGGHCPHCQEALAWWGHFRPSLHVKHVLLKLGVKWGQIRASNRATWG